jgi:PAS domain S-box-containing protein
MPIPGVHALPREGSRERTNDGTLAARPPSQPGNGRASGGLSDMKRSEEPEQEPEIDPPIERSHSVREMLQAILDESPILISFLDASGKLLFVNREWTRVLGWTLDEARDITMSEALSPDLSQRKRALDLVRGGEIPWTDFRIQARDGRALEVAWTRIVLSDGTRLSLGRDITERKRLETQLENNEAYLREGQRISRTGSWAWDVTTSEVFWSEETYRIFDLDPATTTPALGATLRLAHADDAVRLKEELDRAVAAETDFESTFRVIRPDGTVRHVHSKGHPSRDDSGTVVKYIGVVMDITERVLAREREHQSFGELQALAERLRGTQEEERTRVAGAMHDEVGQVLTALQMDVAWLQKRLPAADGAGGKLAEMSALIDTTLAAVQRIASDLRPGILDEFGLEAAVEWFVGAFAKRTGVRCGVASELGGQSIDSARATEAFRIVQEALTNVERHSRATRAHVRLGANAERVVLEVHDNGRGIPPERLTDSRCLGLIGMRESAHSLGGEVAFLSGPAGGTTVAVSFPLSPARRRDDG